MKLERSSTRLRARSANERLSSLAVSAPQISQNDTKPNQYGAGKEAERSRDSLRPLEQRFGIENVREKVQEQIEQIIEEREDILDTSGGSSDATTIVGDDFDEEVTQVGGVTVYDKIMDVATPNGYIEFLGLHSIKLNAPENTAQAQYVEDNQTKKGFIAYRVLRVTTGSPPDTRTLFDYYFLTAMPEPSLAADQSRYIHSQEEEEFINSKLKSGDLLNFEDVKSLMESYFQIDQNPRFEDSIITNRLENTKKIKLSSF
jgi:hypothetical protein